jgi:hypothetical protein
VKFQVSATSQYYSKKILEVYPSIKENFKYELVPCGRKSFDLYIEINTLEELEKLSDMVDCELIYGGIRDDGTGYLEIYDDYRE